MTISGGYGIICLQSETTDGSTVFINSATGENYVDYSSSTDITAGVEHSTDESLFGSSSIYMGGTILLPRDQTFNTLDFWFCPTSNNITIASDYSLGIRYFKIDSNNNILLSLYDVYGVVSGSYIHQTYEESILSAEHNLVLNDWNHIAIYSTQTKTSKYTGANSYCESVIYLTVAINGILHNFQHTFITNFDSGYNPDACFATNPTAGIAKINAFGGYIEELRVTEDIIDENFTPNTSPYPVVTYSVSGIVKEGLSTVARTVRLYNRETGLLIEETTSASDGTFAINDLPTQDECYAICLDDDLGTEYNALIYDRIIPS